MRYHMIVNGFAKDMNRQIKELSGFARGFLSSVMPGRTFLLSPDEEAAREALPLLRGEVCVLHIEEYSPEAVIGELAGRTEAEDIYLFGSDYAGAELSVRTAARAGGCSAVSVHECSVNAPDMNICIKKMTYSNHMEAVFRMKKGPFCIAMAKGMDQAETLGPAALIVEEVTLKRPDFIVSSELEPEEQTDELKDAKVIIAAGRGAKNKENIKALEQAAVHLGGKLGVSRPAAMNAWAPMNQLIGVSGAMLNPEICITAGVSGAAAFYAGIEKSKFIVAVNTDEKAPIMKKADVAVVEDFLPLMDALSKCVK